MYAYRHIVCCLIFIHPFNGPLFETTQVSLYQKGKTLDLLAQETVSGSGTVSYTHLTLPTNREV